MVLSGPEGWWTSSLCPIVPLFCLAAGVTVPRAVATGQAGRWGLLPSWRFSPFQGENLPGNFGRAVGAWHRAGGWRSQGLAGEEDVQDLVQRSQGCPACWKWDADLQACRRRRLVPPSSKTPCPRQGEVRQMDCPCVFLYKESLGISHLDPSI